MKLFRRKHVWRLKNLMLLFPEYRVNLFLNPKVATSTIKNICLANLKPALYHDVAKLRIHHEVRQLANHGQNFPTGQFFTLLKSPKSRNFLFVRNPYTRLLSAYQDKIVDPKKGSRVRVESMESLSRFCRKMQLPLTDSNRCVPFDSFVQWVVHTPNRKLNIHWALQSELSMIRKIHYSDIYKLEENFDQGLKTLLAALEFEENPVPQGLHMTVNKGTQPNREGYYTPALASSVYRKFKPDFIRFGYHQDDWR